MEQFLTAIGKHWAVSIGIWLGIMYLAGMITTIICNNYKDQDDE
ncbi:hypothetical protein [uncultured Clostridium sp.]|nr:hypothetical protein [uncultured Clostridium sp.]